MLLVTEGLFLKRNDISPYEGDVFHQVSYNVYLVYGLVVSRLRVFFAGHNY